MPDVRPANPCFSSGPCAKRPGYSLDAPCRRHAGPQPSRRGAQGPPGRGDRHYRARFWACRLTGGWASCRHPTPAPWKWRCGRMLGARGVDILAFESFGEGWATDVVKQLKLKDARVLSAPYGQLPDLSSGRSRQRRRVHLERHHIRRARAERRLDRAGPQGSGDLRCDVGGVRHGICRGTSSMS